MGISPPHSPLFLSDMDVWSLTLVLEQMQSALYCWIPPGLLPISSHWLATIWLQRLITAPVLLYLALHNTGQGSQKCCLTNRISIPNFAPLSWNVRLSTPLQGRGGGEALDCSRQEYTVYLIPISIFYIFKEWTSAHFKESGENWNWATVLPPW